MSTYQILLPYDFIVSSEAEALEGYRRNISSYTREHEQLYRLSPTSMSAVLLEAEKQGSKKIMRAAQALLAYAEPDCPLDLPCPNFYAFYGMMMTYLERTFQDGWLYTKGRDGCTYAEAISGLRYWDGTQRNGGGSQAIKLYTRYLGVQLARSNDKYGQQAKEYGFEPGDVTNRRIPKILEASGIMVETPELRAAYDATIERYETLVRDGFAKQYHVDGWILKTEDYGRETKEELTGRKVIHDTEAADFAAKDAYVENPATEDTVPMPTWPIVRVFDLKLHTFYSVNSDYMTPYVYNKGLIDSLVLPESHRDLLDVLTTDLSAFLGDIVEGKSAGNVILSKGIPGVGKTLSAEIYSEVIEKPLYSIHSGSLGTSPETVNKRLSEIFKRSKRWDCVLLLDEADVFVMQRGGDIELNAIVAEFLRAMEYFDGLLFMTTNRPDDIDDAILSRCAAIIHYGPPTPAAATRIWQVLAKNFGVKLDDSLISQLVSNFPGASGRDIKMLFRLALRVSGARGEDLDLKLFQRCSMFRGVLSAEEVEAEHPREHTRKWSFDDFHIGLIGESGNSLSTRVFSRRDLISQERDAWYQYAGDLCRQLNSL